MRIHPVIYVGYLKPYHIDVSSEDSVEDDVPALLLLFLSQTFSVTMTKLLMKTILLKCLCKF
jgi:hypothetical protein